MRKLLPIVLLSITFSSVIANFEKDMKYHGTPTYYWATMSMYGQYPDATENVFRLVYLGDPALKFQKTYVHPSQHYASKEMKNKLENNLDKVTINAISPNPAVESTNINITLGAPGEVDISVYDISGRRVMTISKYCQVGEHIISVNTGSLSSGVYILNISACDTIIQRKFVVAR